MVGRSGERWSGISVLAARHDDDDDIYIYIYTHTHTHTRSTTLSWFIIVLITFISLSQMVVFIFCSYTKDHFLFIVHASYMFFYCLYFSLKTGKYICFH